MFFVIGLKMCWCSMSRLSIFFVIVNCVLVIVLMLRDC